MKIMDPPLKTVLHKPITFLLCIVLANSGSYGFRSQVFLSNFPLYNPEQRNQGNAFDEWRHNRGKNFAPNLLWSHIEHQKNDDVKHNFPRCWLVAMWWHHFATFDDIILQHLMTSFWMTCTFWILNKQVKNSFLKLCTIFHRSSLDLDLDLDVI